MLNRDDIWLVQNKTILYNWRGKHRGPVTQYVFDLITAKTITMCVSDNRYWIDLITAPTMEWYYWLYNSYHIHESEDSQWQYIQCVCVQINHRPSMYVLWVNNRVEPFQFPIYDSIYVVKIKGKLSGIVWKARLLLTPRTRCQHVWKAVSCLAARFTPPSTELILPNNVCNVQ